MNRFLSEDLGATMVEYCVMAVSVAAVCVTVIAMFGQNVLDLLTTGAGLPF